jgi:SPX domain protein involved in polyphosphate accumulation/uncharacterized membrane protein YidH (DUF202 family)
MIVVPSDITTTTMSLPKERKFENSLSIQDEDSYKDSLRTNNSSNTKKKRDIQWSLTHVTMKDVIQLQDGHVDSSYFRSRIHEELLRISRHIDASEREHLQLAKNLLVTTIASVECASSESSSPVSIAAETNQTLQHLRQQAKDLVQESIDLCKFASEKYSVLKSIIENADKSIGCDGQLLMETGCRHDHMRFHQSAMIAFISDIFSTISLAETAERNLQDSLQTKWVAPSSFERKTIKFWVHESKLYEVMLVLSTLSPLLVYGRSGRLSEDLTQFQSTSGQQIGVWETWSSLISSVYFDSPQLKCYHSRLAREQGSRLLRARWYGKRPEGSELIHLELKTHNEKWVNEKSIKQRVSIQAQRMTSFLARDAWTIEDTTKIVSEASPSYTAQKTEDAAKCLLLMHEMVVQLQLRPCLRTVYKRVAFQSSKSNSLRFTVDKKVTVINERRYVSDDESSWCFPDNFAISSADLDCFPFAVMEVKLAEGDMPSVIEALEQDKSIIRAEKFSKFLTGAATFNLAKLKKLPYWADHPNFARLFQSRCLDNSSSSHESLTSYTSISTSSSKENAIPLRSPNVGINKKCNVFNSSANLISRSGINQSPRPDDNKARQSRMKLKSMIFRKNRPPKSHLVASNARVRVEPKSFFANERTLIQWITGALLLLTVAALLIDIDNSAVTHKIGFTIVLCSAFILCYGVFVYYRRIYLMTTGSAYGYVDYVGPILLASCVLASVAIVLYFLLYTAPKKTKVVPISSSIHNVSGVCEQYTFDNLSKLEFQPSDVIVDSRRNLLLVPSLSQIVSVPLDKHQLSRPRVLIDIPGADIEALTSNGRSIYAVSEGKGESNLFELKWNSGKLHVVQQFLIATEFVEGIAYVPDSDNHDSIGKLYVAGNNREGTRGFIDIYDIPIATISNNSSATAELVELTGRPLNSNLLAQGLADSKIASIIYFENILYILHDNAEVVRSWNVQEGEMLAEWKLPFVGGGFSKQWEGLALERRSNCSQVEPSVFLRGAGSDADCPSSLILHLTLDSPPQIWSVAVSTNATRKGSVVLPPCAAPSEFNATLPSPTTNATTTVPV